MQLLSSLLSFILPLVGMSSYDPLSLTDTVLAATEGIVEPLTAVGKGIASVFLLVVVFVYVSQILDGGKFQVKMLVPLVVYLAVCNFGLVAKPCVYFAVTIQRECRAACVGARQNIIGNIAGKDASQVTSIFDAFVSGALENADETEIDFQVAPDEVGSPGETSEEKKNWFARKFEEVKAWGSNLLGILGRAWDKYVVGYFWNGFVKNPLGFIHLGLTGLIAMFCDIIAQLVELAVSAMGAIMMGIVIAFGPITWAFAVWPGNTKTIGAWAIRLCQFALYSPICCLISTFCLSIIQQMCSGLRDVLFGSLSQASDGITGSLLPLIALLLGLTAALMSVPAIASMIIEGAQGAVALSQGLQTATSMMTMTSALGEPFRDKKGLNKQDFQMKQLDAVGKAMGAKMPDLKDIGINIDGNTGGKK